MLTHIELLGRVSREGIGTWQVGDADGVALVFEASLLGIHRHTAVISHVGVTSREGVENGALARVGITHQSNANLVDALLESLLHIVVGRGGEVAAVML